MSEDWDFPGGPVAKTLHTPIAEGPSSIPVGELHSTCRNWDQVQLNKQIKFEEKKNARWLSDLSTSNHKTPLQEGKSNNSEGGKYLPQI